MDTHTKTIDGIGYTTTTLPTSNGLRVMVKLVALFGETGLKVLFDVLGKEGLSDEAREEILKSPAVIGKILGAVARSAADDGEDGGRGIMVVKDLLIGTKADRVKIGDAEGRDESVHMHFDTHFQGRFAHLASVAVWVGWCNFVAP